MAWPASSQNLHLLNLNMSFDMSQDRFVTLDLFDGLGFGGALLSGLIAAGMALICLRRRLRQPCQ